MDQISMVNVKKFYAACDDYIAAPTHDKAVDIIILHGILYDELTCLCSDKLLSVQRFYVYLEVNNEYLDLRRFYPGTF